jgi:hypothetical protein
MTQVSAELRRAVIERAMKCCEYCKRGQSDHLFTYHIEHIIAEKHGGESVSENLALSCPECNIFKGSDVASYHNGILTALYHPRQQVWADHFRLNGATIEGITATGRVTVQLLQMNRSQAVEERALYISLGTYPCTDM